MLLVCSQKDIYYSFRKKKAGDVHVAEKTSFTFLFLYFREMFIIMVIFFSKTNKPFTKLKEQNILSLLPKA